MHIQAIRDFSSMDGGASPFVVLEDEYTFSSILLQN